MQHSQKWYPATISTHLESDSAAVESVPLLLGRRPSDPLRNCASDLLGPFWDMCFLSWNNSLLPCAQKWYFPIKDDIPTFRMRVVGAGGHPPRVVVRSRQLGHSLLSGISQLIEIIFIVKNCLSQNIPSFLLIKNFLIFYFQSEKNVFLSK